MDWPLTPVERLQRFRPPFCPRRDCPEHLRRGSGYRPRRHGSYTTRRGRVHPRFRCPACRRTFSRQAFSPSYYLKRPELLPRVAAGLVGGAAHRQIARMLGCAPSTVTRLAPRIGRHCLLLSLEAVRRLGVLAEPVVLDHFETFEWSQDLQLGFATAVGYESWFIYDVDPAPHGRAGRLSPAQRRRLSTRPRRQTRGGVLGSTRRSLDRLLALGSGRLRLISDGHPAYRHAVATHPHGGRIHHDTHPNPPRGPKGSPRSAAAVARDRALFPVDVLHGLIRHSQAAHRRETIAFGRRLNALTERLWLFAVWRNFVKRRSERRPGAITPAMALGLTDRRWSWRAVLARRRFPDRTPMSEVDTLIYGRSWRTSVLRSNALHALRLAY